MKRFLTILLASLAVAGLLCVGVSASSFDGAAAELASIGVLKGSAEGFQLDQVPTRAQAAIMLVRLFGAEDEAKAAYAAGELECPFTDVGEAAAPSVAWLAAKGLAGGTSADTFGASSPCTAKAYTIFLLRALGYRDDADLTAAGAQEFAMGIGLLDTSLLTGEFLRDDLVSMTYQALGTDLKDGSAYLLESLIESGAVDASAAKPITDKIEAYRALQASGAAMASGVDADIDAAMEMSVSVSETIGGRGMDLSEARDASVRGSIRSVVDEDIRMAVDLTVTMDGESRRMEMWMKDGVSYVRSGGEAYRTPVEGMGSPQALLDQPSGKTGAAMLPFIAGISAKPSGSDTVYTLTLNDAFAGLLEGVLRTALQEAPIGMADMDLETTLDGTAITYTVDKGGELKSASVDMTFKAGMEAGAGTEGSMTLRYAVDMEMDMDIKASGKDVKIAFPDFSDFKEILGGADGPTGIYGTLIA